MRHVVKNKEGSGKEKVCKQCSRRLPDIYEQDICPSCMEINLFAEVKDYIRNNEVNEQDVASKFEIPIAKVRNWIKEGRIQYKSDPIENKNITNLFCRECGKKIAFGVLCPECHSLEQLKVVSSNNELQRSESGAMRFLGK